MSRMTSRSSWSQEQASPDGAGLGTTSASAAGTSERLRSHHRMAASTLQPKTCEVTAPLIKTARTRAPVLHLTQHVPRYE